MDMCACTAGITANAMAATEAVLKKATMVARCATIDR
jgi:hypothetical protein